MIQVSKKLFSENLRLLSLVVLPGLLFVESLAFAAAPVESPLRYQSCSGRSPLLKELLVRTPEAAPKNGLLVARSAEVWIESKTDPSLKFWARHNFKSGRKEILCASLPAGTEENFSLPILALYDLTADKKTGDSVWQFQVMLSGKRVGLWSQKSGLLQSSAILQSNKTDWFHQFSGANLLLTQKDLGPYKAWILVDFDKAH